MLMTLFFGPKNILNNELNGGWIHFRGMNFQSIALLHAPCFPPREFKTVLSHKTNEISQTARGNNIFSIDAIEKFKMKYSPQRNCSLPF